MATSGGKKGAQRHPLAYLECKLRVLQRQDVRTGWSVYASHLGVTEVTIWRVQDMNGLAARRISTAPQAFASSHEQAYSWLRQRVPMAAEPRFARTKTVAARKRGRRGIFAACSKADVMIEV